jgi:osmoprotectant transport system ATP-binding protein
VSGAAITLTGVVKRHDGRVALGPIDLQLAAGRTTALIGPSGCGKSTLLRLIVGLSAPDEGQVAIGDTVVSPESVRALRRRVGYVIQDGGLFPHLSGRANVALPARNRPTAEVLARVNELVGLTRLPADVLDRAPARLSGGQRQRVAMMRALILDPDVLLLDEPMAALDPMVRAELQTDLKAMFAALHKTVVLVTHDIGEAGYLADQIVLLRAGQIVQAGPLEELFAAPIDPFVTEFVRAQSYRLPLPEGGLP